MAPRLQHHYIGWHRPVLHLAAEWLAGEWTGGVLDLSRWLVVVPTKHSGRRLREHLASLASSRGAAVLPPRVVTPHSLLALFTEGERLPDRTTALAAWTHVLLGLEPSAFPALFPSAPQGRDLSWALACAQRFMQVQHLLGENGDSIGTLVSRESGNHLLEETARWADLARVEAEVTSLLASLGYGDPTAARTRAAAEASPPEGVEAVALLGAPDPIPLALRALTSLSRTLPVHVVVHAPEALAPLFDDWGRPRTDRWSRRSLDIPLEKVRLVPDPKRQGEALAEHVRRHGIAPSDIAVGVPDPELIPFLDKALAQIERKTYDPAGLPLRSHPLVVLLGLFGELLDVGRYESLAALLRHPDYLRLLRRELPDLDPARLLSQLDAFQNAHLPGTLRDVRFHLRSGGTEDRSVDMLRRAVGRLDAHLAGLAQGALGERLLELLSVVYSTRELHLERAEDRAFHAAATAVSELLFTFDGELYDRLGFTRTDRFAMVRQALVGLSYYPEREADSADLLGWLELHWDDAPHLVVTGMNDGRVPESVVGDAFLPDHLRQSLGLACNASRFARDAYLAAALLHVRSPGATGDGGPTSVLFLVGKASASGDPLRPSRLLFLCDDEALPERTRRLFGEVSEVSAAVPSTTRWHLRPPPAPLPDRLPVTALRDYLTCPFRFYLKWVLGMGSVDDRQAEMDALQFGTLCHAALEDFGSATEVRDSDDAGAIAAFLVDSLDRHLASWFGPRPPVAVVVQAEAARQRLVWAAKAQAEERAAGWRIIAVERRLGGGQGASLGGLAIRGRADRVERHEDGRYRVLDYKTRDKPEPPSSVHLAAARQDTPEWQRVDVDGKERRWTDLQLPLYAHFLSQAMGSPVESGYFHLPLAVTETGVYTWEGLDVGMVDSAVACATGIAEAILDWRFWPPGPPSRYDDFEFLCGASPVESVDVAWFEEMLRSQRKGGRP